MRGQHGFVRPVVAALAAATLVVPAAAGVATARPQATPGAAGLGDELFPELGNGGYDVQHYDLAVRYATTAPASPITGTVTIDAVATQSLSRFDLDFAGDAVGSVRVNGRPATFSRSGEELVITPAAPLPKGRPFVTEVIGFGATPVALTADDPLSASFFVHPDGSTTAGQPNGIHRVFPSNDHPSDKASFTFRLDVPAGETAVANGVFVSKHTKQGRTVWTYVQRQPMATELLQLTAGDLQVFRRAPAAGVPIRDVIPTRFVPELGPKLATVSAHLPWMVQRVGPYPFDVYGSLPVEANQGFALETQTLSMYDSVLLVGQDDSWAYEPIMVHELAHQWFGDSVAPAQWKDVWQNEGHATWYEFEYAAQQGHLADYLGVEGLDTLDDVYRFLYARGDLYRAAVGPVASPPGGTIPELFNRQVYYGGALALYALRQQIGDPAFRRLERAWVQRYENGVASTDDFIRLASKVSHQDLRPFLTDWLYGTKTPPMPGHPDWTVTPVPAAPAAARLSAADEKLADHLRLFKH